MDVTVRVIQGTGLVVPMETGIVVLLQPPPEGLARERVLAGLQQSLSRLEGVPFTTAAAEMAAQVGQVAAVSVSENAWSIVAPSGIGVRTTYRGRESQRDGPLHVVQHDPLAISLLPTTSASPFEDTPILGSVPMAGGGIVVTVHSVAEVVDVHSPRVMGVRCGCGCLLPPLALRCWCCGADLTSADRTLELGDRPSLGTLVVDNATSLPLDLGYVVGRDTMAHPDVVATTARALDLRDVGRALSRVHTTFGLRDWDVLVTDQSSANGTFVRPIDGWRWERLDAEVPRRLLPGSDVRVGNHLLRYVPPDANTDPPPSTT